MDRTIFCKLKAIEIGSFFALKNFKVSVYLGHDIETIDINVDCCGPEERHQISQDLACLCTHGIDYSFETVNGSDIAYFHVRFDGVLDEFVD